MWTIAKSGYLIIALIGILAFSTVGYSQQIQETPEIDQKVRQFLDQHEGQWHNMNVPAADGKLLYDLIIENGYTRALEIGTSTGHSAIWIAWALSKTGGKLITIEINEGRYREALKNFKEAGLSEYVDARLADAHELVPELEGPFDFVFCDADKSWYTNYFKAVAPKMEVGGCYTAHNTSMYGVQAFLEYVKKQPNFETTIKHASRSGMSVSYKRAGE